MTTNEKMTSIDDIELTSVPKTLENDVGMSVAGKAPKPAKCFGVRHLQAFLLFLGMLLSYTMRVNLAVAIVAMTDKEKANPDYPVYDWDEKTVSLLLSSFYWGYFVVQVPAAELAKKVGPVPLLAGALFFASVFSSLTPLAANLGSWYLVALRVLQGLSQGSLFPCTHTLLARWIPDEERDVLATFIYSGAQLGTVLGLTLCGVLADSEAGWPSCFYIFGILGVLWAVACFFLGSNRPAKHLFISKEERDFIEDSIGSSSHVGKLSTPWTSILTSLPVWAIVVVECGNGLAYITLLTQLPTYMNYILGFNLSSNGLLSSLPYLAMFIMSFFTSSLSAFVNRRHFVSLTTSRKLFTTIASLVPAMGLVGLTFSTDPTVSVALLTVTTAVRSAMYVGFWMSIIDMAPNFAGTMMGLSNGMFNLVSLLVPLWVGIVVTDNTNKSQWNIVFFTSAGVSVASTVFYLVFGTSKLQEWNEPRGQKKGSESVN